DQRAVIRPESEPDVALERPICPLKQPIAAGVWKHVAAQSGPLEATARHRNDAPSAERRGTQVVDGMEEDLEGEQEPRWEGAHGVRAMNAPSSNWRVKR